MSAGATVSRGTRVVGPPGGEPRRLAAVSPIPVVVDRQNPTARGGPMTIRHRLIALVGVSCLALATGPVALGAGRAAASPVPDCRPSQVRVTTGVAEGAAGTIYVPLVFTNRGAACALWGVPSVQAVTAARRPVGPPARNDSIGQMPLRHVLTRGQSVSSALGVAETGNYPAARCHARRAWGVRVRLGSFAGPSYVRLGISVCTSQASTHVQLVVPGRTGVPTS